MEVLPTIHEWFHPETGLMMPRRRTGKTSSTVRVVPEESKASSTSQVSGAAQVGTGATANILTIQNLQRSAALPSWRVICMAGLQGIVKLLGDLRVCTQRCYWGQGVKVFPASPGHMHLIKTPQKAKEEVTEDFFFLSKAYCHHEFLQAQ